MPENQRRQVTRAGLSRGPEIGGAGGAVARPGASSSFRRMSQESRPRRVGWPHRAAGTAEAGASRWNREAVGDIRGARPLSQRPAGAEDGAAGPRHNGPDEQATGDACGVVEDIARVGFAMGEEGLVPLLPGADEDGDGGDGHNEDGGGKARKDGSGDTEQDEHEDGVLDRVDGVRDSPAGRVVGAGNAREPCHDRSQRAPARGEAHIA